MTDLKYRVGVEGTQEAVGALRSVGQATTGAASTAGDFGRTANEMAQRVAGATNSVAALASRVGSTGVASGASLIGSLAGAVAQFSAMGSVLGPGGAVVGGIAGLASVALPHLISALEPVPAAQAEVARTTSEAATAMVEQASAADAARTALTAFLESLDSGSQTTRLGNLGEQIRIASDELANLGRGTLEQTERRFQLESQLYRLREQAAAIADELDTGDLAGRDRPDGDAADQAEAARLESQRNRLNVEREIYAQREEMVAHEVEVWQAGEAARQAAIDKTAESNRIAGERNIAVFEQERLALAASSDAYHALQVAAQDAALEFSHGYVNSLDQVREAWEQANRAARAATIDGRGMIPLGRLLERSMVAVGNNISETIGGTMVSAFEGAVGAWLDGSKSFVEAAEAMAKGVIRSLVQEAIVQGVVELARGIADMASYQYASGAQHFAAAAAWAAVGGVAGGIGAATGSFGGAGASNASVTSREASDAGREQASGNAGPTNIYVYPGGFTTERDVEGAVHAALIRAGRNGARLPASMVGR